MKTGIVLASVFLNDTYSFSQEKNYSFNLFNAKFSGVHLNVFKKEKQVFKKDLYNLQEYLSDLDNDGINELIVTDYFKNENLIETINSFFEAYHYDCENALKVKDIIASVYINYLNAGETALAIQTMKNYYPFSDINNFINQIIKLN